MIDLDLPQQMAIVANQESGEIMQVFVMTLLAIGAIGIGYLAVRQVVRFAHNFKHITSKLGPVGCVVCAFCTIGMILYGGTKPSILFDDYIADNGSHYITNTVSILGIKFKWRKTRQDLPDETTLSVYKRLKNFGSSWEHVTDTTVGQAEYSLTLENADTNQYYLAHEWLPPVPVHTNGVWLGTFLEKAKGTVGVDKIIIIHGMLEENGRKMNP